MNEGAVMQSVTERRKSQFVEDADGLRKEAPPHLLSVGLQAAVTSP